MLNLGSAMRVFLATGLTVVRKGLRVNLRWPKASAEWNR